MSEPCEESDITPVFSSKIAHRVKLRELDNGASSAYCASHGVLTWIQPAGEVQDNARLVNLSISHPSHDSDTAHT